MHIRLIIVIAALLPTQALAYIGPGAGISAIGTVLALFAAVLLAIIGFIWYPVKRVLRRRKGAQEPRTEDEADSES